jgi:hypothetical protein
MPSPRSLWPPCRPSIASFDGARQAARHQGRSTSARRSAPATGASTSGRRSVSDRSLRQGRQGDTVEAIAPDAQRSDRGMLQGGWTAVRLGRYLSVTAVAVVYVGRAQVAARCAGGPPRVRLPTVVFPSLRDASPHFCLCFCRCAGVPPPEIQTNPTHIIWVFATSSARPRKSKWIDPGPCVVAGPLPHKDNYVPLNSIALG